MVTLNKLNGVPNTSFIELVGLSTDEKPTHYIEGVAIGNGSTFFEIDTSKKFVYDAQNHAWMNW